MLKTSSGCIPWKRHKLKFRLLGMSVCWGVLEEEENIIHVISFSGQIPGQVARCSAAGDSSCDTPCTATPSKSQLDVGQPFSWKSKFLYRYRPEGIFSNFFGLILDPPRYICFYSEKKANSFVLAIFPHCIAFLEKRGGTGTGITFFFSLFRS